MSQPNADLGRPSRALVACLLLAPLAGGCSEMHKYWDRSPTAPQTARDTTLPTVKVLTPSGRDRDHATPVTGDACVVSISAADPAGIARVALYVDDSPAAPVPGPPWQYPWNTTPFGDGSCHKLWATAVDQAGNVASSDTVFARAYNHGPALALTAPADNARVKGLVTVSAQVTSSTPIERVEFLADADLAGTVTAAPWSLTLDTATLGAGDHFLTARATTALGLVGVSPARHIIVNNGAPVVTIDFPESGHRVAAGGTLILSCTALDDVDGNLPPVSWQSSLDGAIGSGPYLRLTGRLSVGTHTLTASTVNAWGTTGSASLPVEVLAQPTYAYRTDIFNGIILPRCYACHYPGAVDYSTSRLDLSTYAGLMAGGVTRAYETIVPCRPDSSLVWNKVTEALPWVGSQMPQAPNPPLPQGMLDKLKTWILEGAPP